MNRTFSQLTFLLAFVCLTSGCSIYHVHSKDVSATYYPSKNTANDIVYVEKLTQDHEVIGYVTVNTERRQQMNDVLEKMKQEAAILGADAITEIQTDATGDWKRLPAQDIIGNGYVRANFSAKAVILK